MNIELKFISLIDNVISNASRLIESAGAQWEIENYQLTIKNMQEIREEVESGNMPKSGGAGLGITRTFSEWDVPESLYKAGHELEEFYQSEYNY
ncbi:MAG: hypothetical protein GY705_14890 [Bacteroidetes bacterium]|nr:hypothetical protein [Bacteroidota bacterium]